MSTDGAGSRLRRLTAGAAALAGLSLFLLAVPRGIAAAVVYTEGYAAVRVLNSGGRLTDEQYATGLRGLGTAYAIVPGDASLPLALARLELRGDEAAKTRAAQHLKEAASLAPNNSYVWSLLARTKAEQGTAPEEVIGYLRLSQLTGRFEWSSILARIPVELAYWDDLEDGMRDIARRDLQRMARARDFMESMVPLYLRLGYRERAVLLEHAFSDSDVRRKKYFLKAVLAATVRSSR